MVLVVKDQNGTITNVYGYIRVLDIEKYVRQKYPNQDMKWEGNIPKEYTGEVTYLPEKDV